MGLKNKGKKLLSLSKILNSGKDADEGVNNGGALDTGNGAATSTMMTEAEMMYKLFTLD